MNPDPWQESADLRQKVKSLQEALTGTASLLALAAKEVEGAQNVIDQQREKIKMLESQLKASNEAQARQGGCGRDEAGHA
jgi:hypothetical protein